MQHRWKSDFIINISDNAIKIYPIHIKDDTAYQMHMVDSIASILALDQHEKLRDAHLKFQKKMNH
jgi:hypothetical protein